MTSLFTNIQMLGSTDQVVNTLRQPVTVNKKRSRPLDSIIDELNRTQNATTTSPNVSNSNSEREILPSTCIKLSDKISPTPTGRRRCHLKDKDNKKRERWLLTRKTWRYMTDAGRKLLPDSIHHGVDGCIPHIEQQFQRVCASEPRFILWRRKASFPGTSKKSKKQLMLLSRHRSSYAMSHAKLGGVNEINDSVDQTIELLQSYLKLRDSYKTTALLGTKTVRPDQTSSPSSRRPTYSSKSLNPHNNLPFSIEHNSDERCERVLLDRLKFLKTTSLSDIQIDNITPDILKDKGLLKKIYNLLKKQQLHRILHSCEPTKSSFNRASSLTSLVNFTSTGYQNAPPQTELFSYDKPTVNSTFNTTKTQKPIAECQNTEKLKRPDVLQLGQSTKSLQATTLYSKKSHSDAIHRREKCLSSCGTQTNFIPLSELKLLANQYELMIENNAETSLVEEADKSLCLGNSNRRKSSIDNEDVSQSVSDTIKRYLRMARKKSVHDGDANRFKSVNYDRNLRNIKAKGEINPPGMDEENNKAVQTLDAWALIALDFIRGIENSKNLQHAHISWQKDLDERMRKKKEWDTLSQSQNNVIDSHSTKNHTHETAYTSAPTSPTRSFNSAIDKKTGRGPSALLSSSSQFLSNLWNTSLTDPFSSTQSIKNGNSLNETYTSSKNENTNMQKSKSLSNVGQFVSRKFWGGRSKCQNRHDQPEEYLPQRQKWTPSENCAWISTDGQILQLTDTSLEKLSNIEAEMLVHIALEKIKELNIGLSIDLKPKVKAQRKRVISKKRALTTSFFDIAKKDENNGRAFLFGTPLEHCLSRDRKRAGDMDTVESKHSLPTGFDENCSRVGKSNDNIRSYESLPTKSLGYGRCSPLEHTPPTEYFMSRKKSLSLSNQMSCSQFDMRYVEVDLDRIFFKDSKNDYVLNIPIFVIMCIEYLEEHGLQKVGLFRVSTSKKRVQQLREEFDKAKRMCIPDNTCPHDVATLLKEFLRDLPEPLLCRKLYTAFLETQRIRNRRLQLEAISHLIKLLPIVHRDTLFVLLKFLGNVAAHCDDVCSRDGIVQLTGNKMDSINLSTVFAPNILREATPKTVEYKEQGNMGDAINVIRIMIDHYEEIFKVPVEIIDVLYSHMLDTCPEKLHDLITNKMDQSLSSPNKCQQVHLKGANYYSPSLPEERRQSTPVLLDHVNVFAARLQISVPEEASVQPADSGVPQDSKKQITSSEPKLPASISNIGGATLKAKTAGFEKTIKNCNYDETLVSKVKPLYKRHQIIPSAKRQN